MSKRRESGDIVRVIYPGDQESYICEIVGDRFMPCPLASVYDITGHNVGCDDPQCKEWDILKVIRIVNPDDDETEVDYLYHVGEHYMSDS